MNKRDLQRKLNRPYSQQNWKEVVEFVFPNVSILSQPTLIPVQNDKVESFYQIGNVRLNDGKTLALFELKLKENVNIIRNRVELNDIVSKYIDQERFHGVLSIFEQGKEDYRFTFSARATEFDEEQGDFINKATDTKRYTYVLGKNESCRTAAERFYDLSEHKTTTDIKAIEKAFSVETLSKNFFREYKQQYELFVEYLLKTPSYFTAVFKDDDKAIRDFVKLLLGRLVFIKFVQKKGWLGVPASESGWTNGNFNFLEDAFANFEPKDNFYSAFLNPLFFEGFDAPNRPNDVFRLTGTKVPFLSGGLFDNADPKGIINFPKEYFEGLLDFFGRYNFTIDENDTSLDREVGIDPEMLGHIFENLLEDNKDKGAFYTPKEIVRYMCQESLKEYLKTFLQEQNQWPSDEQKQKDLEGALHRFITKKEASGVIDFDATLAKALKDVKICDPAIGSGAFPMGLLYEIFHLVQKLYDASPDKVGAIWKMETWQPDTVKLNIIQQSIYGVDIEKGAVDIARLRFWLSLIVDSDEPHALPHLDYKIVVGDSLVSKLEDTIIDIDWEVTKENAQTDMFGNSNVECRKAILEDITNKQKQVFDPDSDDDTLSLEIRNLKIDLLINQLELMVKTQGLEQKPTIEGKNLNKQTELWLQTLGWKEQIKRLQYMKQGSKTPLEFFDWKLDFPEIMNPELSERLGFDIVIGNPPYGSKLPKNDQILFRNEYSDLEFKIDSYQVFVLHANKLAKVGGCVTYIIPSGLMDNYFSKKIRKNLLKRNIVSIIELDDNVFKTAVIHSMILIWKTNFNKNYFINCNIGNINHKLSFPANSGHFIKEENFNFSLRKVEFSKLISKLERNSLRLEDILKIKDGIDTGNNNLYVSNEYRQNWKKLIGGSDIDRWKIKSFRYVNYGEHLANPRDPELFENSKIVIRETGDKIIATIDHDSHYALSTLYSGFIIDNRFTLKSILGLLHSEIAHFLMILMAFGRTKGAFTKTRIFHYYSLPVDKAVSNYNAIIDLLVDCLLFCENKLNDKKYEISLTNILNNIFYAIYFQNELSDSIVKTLDYFNDKLSSRKVDSYMDIDEILKSFGKYDFEKEDLFNKVEEINRIKKLVYEE